MAVKYGLGMLVVGAALSLVATSAAASPGRASLLEPITVNSRVDGDVVAMGANVVLGPKADVRGHVVALFGAVQRDPGARVEGRVVGIKSLVGGVLTEEGTAVPVRVRLGLDLLLASVWLVTAAVLAALLPGRIVIGAWAMDRLGLRVLGVGIMVVVTVIMALLAAVSLGPGVAVPVLTMLMLVAMAGKAFGLTLLGAALGGRLASRVTRLRLPVTVTTFIGVAVLVSARFIPVVGGLTWAVVSLWAVGAGLLGATLGRAALSIPASA